MAHAANWRQGDTTTTLSDQYSISFTPSATMHAAAINAAESPRGTNTLVALGDPRDGTYTLPAAAAEVECIAARFFDDRSTIALGSDATSEFLVKHASSATHLHLACHARGAAFDFREASLQLADGDLPLTRITALGGLNARLAVISACETGVADISNVSEESYSIGSVLLVAGAAAALVSLWPVDDYATALLMPKFYEELFGADRPSPGHALRRAQHWLRTLTAAAHKEYIAAYPKLEAEFNRRRRANQEPGRTRAQTDEDSASSEPFVHPQYWAAFVVLGA
jgi:CHAT domain-containing protein